MTDPEFNGYIRNEWGNDRSWLAAGRGRGKRTRAGLFDLVMFVLMQRHSRAACCPCC